ncbi:MAG: type II toxin-antitoxin system RelE/ParE family toxin [Gemmataceae bacterium]
MKLPIVYRPEALSDLVAARDWYERELSGLGDQFADVVEELIDRIETMPEMYAALFRGVRPAKLRKFPFVLYYRVLNEWIEVLALMHGSRDPQAWRSRA